MEINMSEINWIDYIGIVLGLIGTATGCTGALISYKNYKKVQQVKSLDLRIELRRTVNEVRALLIETENLLPRAYKSRLSVHSAKGILCSGFTAKWQAEHTKDRQSLESIKERFNRAEHNLNTDSYETLEQKLDAIEQLKLGVLPIVTKYQEALKEDDKVRERIRDQHEKFA
ncbi:DNA repair protein [Vibrio crassostreae]|uniref:hypothetical protein n=1 Tax=Vibrio crassostreae TaxID=246167 RepID=UPI001051335F|nr:hypothetical protein [Vibrio crassostreae]TCT97431.1 hypothetical protein EDB47_13339 [Vibrio crassostreae]CAK2014865.1 DNA repair protein [Vibrio crassostreae]CAK2324028.1 DNA repair protein [Vibrio crassostreae]CAK2816289.1 DNA repair protein [Vibrio crassostreae]CAK2827521.1 DNA repair protein [Vibrio crassostreae]